MTAVVPHPAYEGDMRLFARCVGTVALGGLIVAVLWIGLVGLP